MRRLRIKPHPHRSRLSCPVSVRPVSVRLEVGAKPRAAFGGGTLIEVLMALMLMGVGVTTLASLFPISILRAIQATQLTSAAILRYNAEAAIELFPSLIHEPDGVGVDTTGLLPDGPNAAIVEHFQKPENRLYMVDPLGWHLVDPDTTSAPDLQNTFGNDGIFVPPALPTDAGNIRRFHGGLTTEAAADQMVTLPDSWVFQESTETTFNSLLPAPVTSVMLTPAAVAGVPDGLGFDGGEGVAGFDDDGDGVDDNLEELGWPGSDDDVVRAVLFDLSGRFSQVRRVRINASGLVEWIAPVNFDVARVHLEVRKRRYTWMLTVRKRGSGDANVDVVVFFNRSFGVEDEILYSAVFVKEILPGADGQPGFANFDDNEDGTDDDPAELGWPGSDDFPSQRARIGFSATNDPPFFKRGGFVLDATNLHWYRIVSIENETEDTSTTPTTVTVDLVLDRPIRASNAFDVNGDGMIDLTDPAETGYAIFMRGVIEVFPLGIRTLP